MFLNIDSHSPQSLAAKDSDGEKITFSELIEFSEEFKNKIPRRALIFILSKNSIGSLCGYVASIENKIVPLIIGEDLDDALLQNLYDTYKPNYLWLPKENKKFESIDYKVVWEFSDYHLVKLDNPIPDIYENLSLLLSTSGSTGSPKLVRHSYSNISANAKNIASFFKIKSTDRAIAVLPLQYTMGLSVVTSYLYAGATVLLTDLSLLDTKFWDFLKTNKATSFSGVPFSYDILRKLRFFRMDLPHLELINQGGGKLEDRTFIELAAYAEENNKRFIATYGQTEGTARMSYLPAHWAVEKTGSIGIPIPEGKMYLLDENKQLVETIDTEGELVYEGPNVTLGYAYQLDDLKKGDENKGILFTGDYATRDKDGCYYVRGRKSRFLKIMGSRVSLDQVEMLIKNRLGIECVASGKDDLLIISITDSQFQQEVVTSVTRDLNIFHKAVQIQVIDEFKRNSAGKLRLS